MIWQKQRRNTKFTWLSNRARTACSKYPFSPKEYLPDSPINYTRDFFIFHALGVLKYATKHDYSELMESAKEQAILLEPLETFRYAVESKNHALLDDAGARALLVAPVEVFELAAQHGSDRLVEKVAMAAMNYQKPTSVTLNLFGNRPLEMNEEGAISLRTTYIFKILEYAAEHEQQELTNKAAVLSRNKPDFAFIAGQVRHRTLVVWVSG